VLAPMATAMLLLVGGVAVKQAHATFPGANGKIAFQSGRDGGGSYSDLFTMNPDGSEVTNITDTMSKSESGAVWSPDGSQIAFSGTDNFGRRVIFRRIYRRLAKGKGSGSLRRITVFVRHENVVRLLEFFGYRLE
jgi:hypothetical protein